MRCSSGIPPLSRALRWPYHGFYIHVLCRADLLKQKSIESAELKGAVNVLNNVIGLQTICCRAVELVAVVALRKRVCSKEQGRFLGKYSFLKQ